MSIKPVKKKIGEIIKALLFSVALMVLFEAIELVMSFIGMGLALAYAIYRAFRGDEFYLSRPIMSFATGPDAMMLSTILAVGMACIVFLIL